MIRGRQRRFQPFSSRDTGSLRCSCSLRSSPLFIDHDGSTGLTGLSCPARLPFRTCNQHDHSDSKLLFQTKTVPNLNQRNNSRTSNAPPELMLSPTLLSPGVWHGSLTPVSLCQAPGLTFFFTDCSYPTSVPPFLCQLRAIES